MLRIKHKPILLLVLVSAFLGLSSEASSQAKSQGPTIFVSAESPGLSISRNPKIRIELKNNSGKTWYLKKDSTFALNLERTISQPDDCFRGDCIFAMAAAGIKQIPADKFVQFEISFKELYWNDSISSFIDINTPKNYSETILPGKYRVYATLSIFPEPWVNEESAVALIRSNEIFLTL